MKSKVFLLSAVLALATASFESAVRAETKISAEEIMALVRKSYASQDYKLVGSLRNEATGKVEAYELTMQQKTIRFRFENPAEIVGLDLAVEPSKLYRVAAGGKKAVPLADYNDPIRGMAMNYEDLSLRFTYWPNPQLLRSDKMKTQKCWVVRVTNPSQSGPYGSVEIWVHQGSGGVARMNALDRQGQLVKRFEVTSVQKLDDTTILKEMRIEAFVPAGSKNVQRTIMKLDKS